MTDEEKLARDAEQLPTLKELREEIAEILDLERALTVASLPDTILSAVRKRLPEKISVPNEMPKEDPVYVYMAGFNQAIEQIEGELK